MKYKWTFTLRVTLLASLALPVPNAAQQNVAQPHQSRHHHYELIDIGTFGGPNSNTVWGGPYTRTLNSKGTVTGEADILVQDPYCIVDCSVTHVFQWQNGKLSDLGALPGVNLSVADWINSSGWIAGISENGVIDPVTGYPETDAVLWKNGKPINLRTLGGNSSEANSVNNKSQVVGGATNSIPDPFSSTFPAAFCGANLCILEGFGPFLFPVATQVRAVLWQGGDKQDLGTLGGPDAIAMFVNERGEVAGESYINSLPNSTTGVPTIDPFFIGKDGKMVDTGNLGGSVTYLTGLNNRGQITGTMTLPGDATYHPFLWGDGVLTDLGTLGGAVGEANAVNDAGEVVGWAASETAVFAFLWKDRAMFNLGTVNGDQCSVSDGVNSREQIVGESSPSCFHAPTEEAFLWEDGSIVDLNTLIPAHSGMELAHAFSVNERGEINGEGVLPNGDQHAFLLIPCDENHPAIEGCDYGLVDSGTDPPAVRIQPALPQWKPQAALRQRRGRSQFAAVGQTK